MANSRLPAVDEESNIPRHLAEIILKLDKIGNSPEDISYTLGLSLSQVQKVLSQAIDDDKATSILESFALRSSKFRCAYSGRLMASPVIGPDKCLYDKSSIKSANLDFSEEKTIEDFYLREEIQSFSKATLQHFEFNSDQVSEGALTIATECLSVLDVHTDFESFLRVLGPLSRDNLRVALGMLRRTVTEEGIQSLLTQLADRANLQQHLLLGKEFLQQPRLRYARMMNSGMQQPMPRSEIPSSGQDGHEISEASIVRLVDELIEMSFERNQIEIALKVANYHKELAINYLIDGIPTSTIQIDI